MLSLKDLESIWWLFSATDLVCIFMGGIQWASMKLDLQPRGFRMLRKFDKNKQDPPAPFYFQQLCETVSFGKPVMHVLK